MDGMVLSDDVPTPGLHEYKAVVQPIRFAFDDGAVAVTNLRHSADASDLRFRWRVEHDGPSARRPVTWTCRRWRRARPCGAAARRCPVADDARDLADRRRRTRATTPPGRRPGTSSRPRRSTARAHRRCRPLGCAGSGGARDAGGRGVRHARPSGRRRSRRPAGSLAGRPVSGPRLELWRAPTDNDEGAVRTATRPDRDAQRPRRLQRRASGGEQGLDRLTQRLVSSWSDADDACAPSSGSARPTPLASVSVETTWTLDEGELELRVEIVPSTGWKTVWPRIGMRFDLPDSRVSERAASDWTGAWFGLGPLESYPDSMHAAQVGRYESTIEGLSADMRGRRRRATARPCDGSTLRAGDTDALRLTFLPDTRGRRPGFTVSRHTPQQIAAARHPFELPASDTTYLFVDAAQHGLGSRACGPDVWPTTRCAPRRARCASGSPSRRGPEAPLRGGKCTRTRRWSARLPPLNGCLLVERAHVRVPVADRSRDRRPAARAAPARAPAHPLSRSARCSRPVAFPGWVRCRRPEPAATPAPPGPASRRAAWPPHPPAPRSGCSPRGCPPRSAG